MEQTNPFDKPVSKQEFNGYWIPRHNAKVMKQGLEENKAPFLPDSTGIIKAEPVYNLATGYCLPANRLIPVQFAKMEKGFNSKVVATRTTINGMENNINENEKGVFYNFKDEQGEIHTSESSNLPRSVKRKNPAEDKSQRCFYGNCFKRAKRVPRYLHGSLPQRNEAFG